MTADFERDGFALIPGVLDAAAVADALSNVERLLNADGDAVLKGRTSPAYGARNLLKSWPESVGLLQHPSLLDHLRTLLGSTPGVVRGLYFDKPPGHSWALPWHRDFTIAVKAHHPSTLFTKPTIKAGVPHVEAPQSLLEKMVTVRIHLDPMRVENGALRVVPGSHHRNDTVTNDAVTIECAAGDVLLMRPLLLHSSGHSDEGTHLHRRIVHLECAGTRALDDGFEWQDWIGL
jgi:Phytanoyl-CoA dioxygenase (PhyH)